MRSTVRYVIFHGTHFIQYHRESASGLLLLSPALPENTLLFPREVEPKY